MLAWFKEYWYLALIFVGVCIAAAVIFHFAGKSYKSYRTAYRKQEAELKRLTALKERFVPLTEKAIAESDSEETLEGVALAYQLFLQKQEDMEREFSLLSKEKRYAYILDVFVQDKSIGEFFRRNGDILKNEIIPALCLIGMDGFAKELEVIRKMFDPTDESTSLDEKKIEELQYYSENNNLYQQIRLKSAEYIKANFQLFVK